MVMLLLGIFQYKSVIKTEAAFSGIMLQQHSQGDEVKELQSRLTFLGYYNGRTDGTFGKETRQAVTWFQERFGLQADGIVGVNTKQKLVKATKNWKPQTISFTTSASKQEDISNISRSNSLGLSDNDLKFMANAVYGESRGEPYEGQVAVAAVILNRVKSQSFPNTAYGVIFQPGAFTAVADGQIWLEPNSRARQAVQDAINGWDPSGGCLYYFNPETATSKWIWTRAQVKTIGKHVFCM